MAKPTRTPMTTAGLPALGSTTRTLIQMATKPDRQSREYGAWIKQEDFLAFLRDERQRDEGVLYAGLTHCFCMASRCPHPPCHQSTWMTCWAGAATHSPPGGCATAIEKAHRNGRCGSSRL